MEAQGIRINKYLSEAGVCSRRKADEYIVQGRVKINGQPAEMGTKVMPGDQVYVKNQLVEIRNSRVVLAFHKPKGLVCSTRGQGAETVFEYLQYPVPLYYVGRLDKDSEGLLLLTNDGNLANSISKAGNSHEKEYEVEVNKPVTSEFIRQMGNGVPILNTITRRCQVVQTGERGFRIILTQGLNRQIRRMCEYCGYRVERLTRIRIMNIDLQGLEQGDYRELEEAELQELEKQL
ncbi:MAG: pseudouridine synthase [Bacteroides sp.]|nr:pseudouridine synthase [Bacteroides sp.]MCM1550682.1 pseudouridine synthase [Clostridium sp.]